MYAYASLLALRLNHTPRCKTGLILLLQKIREIKRLWGCRPTFFWSWGRSLIFCHM